MKRCTSEGMLARARCVLHSNEPEDTQNTSSQPSVPHVSLVRKHFVRFSLTSDSLVSCHCSLFTSTTRRGCSHVCLPATMYNDLSTVQH
jgi:hypothetical protein